MSDRSFDKDNDEGKSNFHRYILDLIMANNLEKFVYERDIDVKFVIREFLSCCKRATGKDLEQKSFEELDEDDDVASFKKYLIERLTEIQDWSVHHFYTWNYIHFNLPFDPGFF